MILLVTAKEKLMAKTVCFSGKAENQNTPSLNI